MLPDAASPGPASLMMLLAWFGSLFTAPSFRAFCGLACGFLAQAGRRTVCGMLAGARLSRCWPHDRAHQFFSRARWNADDLGLAAAKLVVALLAPTGQPVTVAIDDTLFRRRGKNVWAAGWFHDGSAPGPATTGQAGHQGHELRLAVVAGLPHGADAGRGAARAPHPRGGRRRLRRGRAQELPPSVTWTTRLRKDAALYELPPARTGRRGRPRAKGVRLPSLDVLARRAAFGPVTVTRYGKTATIHAEAITCLWHGVFGPRRVQVLLIRDVSATGYDLALVTTDLDASPAAVIERYASRWSIEVAIEDARQVFGAGQVPSRTARAVERTIPFQLACQAIPTCWYATAGHDSADTEIRVIRLAWEDLAA
jgi:hypothetical protein